MLFRKINQNPESLKHNRNLQYWINISKHMKKKAVKCDKLSREEEIIRIYTEMTQVLKLVD